MSETRIAMWSGPRNISTAMMYSFDNRPDTFCVDEPLYAHYLARTKIPHPDAQKVIDNGVTDWEKVVESLCGEIPGNAEIWYQKHMTHHILPHMELEWLSNLKNCLLIRNPREVILSLSKITDQIDARATGLPEQTRLLDHILETTGQIPIIVDSQDILENPEYFMSEPAAKLVFQTLGWTPSKFLYPFNNEIVALDPNFYPVGWVVAVGKKSLIKCEGESLFYLGEKKYNNIETAITENGTDILKYINEWNWEITKEWLILKGNGEWITAFSSMYNCPFRTAIRC